MSAEDQPTGPPERSNSEPVEKLIEASDEKPVRPEFRRSLSSANFAPNGDLYDSLEDDWLTSTNVGELSLFDFLDSFSVLPETLDKLNQRFKLQSREVPHLLSEIEAIVPSKAKGTNPGSLSGEETRYRVGQIKGHSKLNIDQFTSNVE